MSETNGNGQWFVSPFNPPVEPNQPVITLHDCTIREGEQQPGYHFSIDQKLRLAHALDEAGVDQIETGIPGASTEQREACAAIARAGLRARVTGVCRAKREEVQAAADAGLWGALCSMPADPLQLKHKNKLTEDEAIERMIDITQFAHGLGLYVIFSPAYTTRADLPFLTRLIRAVIGEGHADRVRVVDSAGSGGPEAIAFLVRTLKEVSGLPIEVHCHDDFGLATANSLAAVQAGAEVVSCSVAGIGPRAGNAALEEVVLSLALLYGRQTRVKLESLVPLVRVVEDVSGISLAPYKAISGRNLLDPSEFAKVGSDENALTSQAFLPTLVGHPSPS